MIDEIAKPAPSVKAHVTLSERTEVNPDLRENLRACWPRGLLMQFSRSELSHLKDRLVLPDGHAASSVWHLTKII